MDRHGYFRQVLRNDLAEAAALFGLYPNKVKTMRELVRESTDEERRKLEILTLLSCSDPAVRRAYEDAVRERGPKLSACTLREWLSSW